MRTATRGGRGIAWAVVLAWHALVGWWLLHAVRLPRTPDDDLALQVVYVTLPPAAASSPEPSAMARPHDSRRKLRLADPAPTAAMLQVQPALPDPPANSAPADTTPSMRLLEQALAGVRQPAAMAPRDPLADRHARLPAADRGRFRMREPVTPASALAWLGRHVLAPAGYEADPCPRNRRNIAALLAGGDTPRLQLELAFEREHCRP